MFPNILRFIKCTVKHNNKITDTSYVQTNVYGYSEEGERILFEYEVIFIHDIELCRKKYLENRFIVSSENEYDRLAISTFLTNLNALKLEKL